MNRKKDVPAVIREFAAACLGALAFCGLSAQLPSPCGAAGTEGLRASGNSFSLPEPAAARPSQLPDVPQFVMSAALLPPEVTAKLPELGIKLADRDLWRLAEVYNFLRQVGPSVWPEITGVEATPVQFVFPRLYDVLIGHPNPPADCLPFSATLPAGKFCYRRSTALSYGGGAGYVNKVYTISVNTLEYMDEVENAQHPGSRHDYKRNSATAAHELFHGFQRREMQFLPPEGEYPPMGKADYPYTDAGLNTLLGLEGRILADALSAGDEAGLREFMRDFMAVRAARHALLPEGIPVLGRYMELVEGTAEYITFSFEFGAHPGLTPLPETLLDPRFPGYGAPDKVTEVLKARLSTLHLVYASEKTYYSYPVGAALGRVLDRLNPSWKEGFFRRCSGLGRGLDTELESVVSPDNSPARVERAKARYDAPRLLAEAERDLAAVLEKSRALMDAFYAAPGRRVRLAFPGTPSTNVLVAGPADLAEYGRKRLYKLGCQLVQYGKGAAWSRINFSAASPPALLDREAVTLEMVLPASAPASPDISAASVTRNGGETVYEGNVSLDNGVFSWTGDKLTVSERDGVTLLSFYPAK